MFDKIKIWNSKIHDKGKLIPLKLEDNVDVDVEKDVHNDWKELNEFWHVHECKGVETSQPNMQHSMRKLACMDDYTSCEWLFDEDTLAHFALFVGCGPISFFEVIKSSIWRKDIDTNI